jgi:GTP:adenosylcobinamide-phosphate guanylyltransferase
MESHGLEATLVMDGMVPAGVNVVDGERLSEEDEGIFVTEHVPFALNVNTPKEVELAESLLITEVDKIKQGGI